MGTTKRRPARPGAQKAPAEALIRNAVREAVDATSVNRVAELLGLSAESTLRLAGGLPVQVGTLAVAEKNVSKLTKKGDGQ